MRLPKRVALQPTCFSNSTTIFRMIEKLPNIEWYCPAVSDSLKTSQAASTMADTNTVEEELKLGKKPELSPQFHPSL